MKRKIEIFSAGCHACKQTIETITKLAGEHEVHIHDMHQKEVASRALTLTTVSIIAVGAWLPYSAAATPLGFTPLPGLYWPILLFTLLGYVGLTQTVKGWLLRRKWI